MILATTNSGLDVDLTPIRLLPGGLHEDAQAFVLNSWIRSYRDFRPPGTHADDYARGQRRLILFLMRDAEVTMAHLPGDPSLFIGWCCRRGAVGHYVYVRQDYRRHGVAGMLTEDVTHVTHRATYPHIRDWAGRRGWTYNPYLLVK